MSATHFDLSAYKAALGAEADEFDLIVLAECESTNTSLMRLAGDGAASRTVVVAERQTAGRGRRDRAWISSLEDSLTFSLLWRFASTSRAPEALSLVVGLGLHRALRTLGAEVEVKWPNDILYRRRKLAGVLIEVQPGDIKSAIIGLGLNLRLPPAMPADIAASASALDAIGIPVPSKEKILALVLSRVAAVLHRYEQEGFVALRGEWQAAQAFRGEMVRITGGAEDIVGICNGVNARGELLVNTEAGLCTVMTGDVSLRQAA